jgi:hypothetical protein
MNENEWVAYVRQLVDDRLDTSSERLEIIQGKKLPYAYEIREFSASGKQQSGALTYETDLLVVENTKPEGWKPRLVIEAKLSSITTHAAITYSEKAATHKTVVPYLRYGILIGNRKHYPLPGRLFRHGAYFDFMLSWQGYKPQPFELNALVDLIDKEVKASRLLEQILYESRSPKRTRYYVLHKPLKLEESPEVRT